MTEHSPSSSAEKVLLVDLAEGFGGAEARVIDTAIGLGPGVASVAVLEGSKMAKRCITAGVDILPLARRRHDPRMVGSLRGVIRDGGFSVVDAHNVQSQLWGHLAARAEDVPVMVTTVHSEYRAENRGLKGWSHQQVLRRNGSWGCRFIAVSDRIGEYVAGLVPSGARITTIRRSFPPAIPTAVDPIDRSVLGWGDDDVVFGVIGRLAPAKGHDVLLDAIGLLRARGVQSRMFIVGSGEGRARLEERIRSEGHESDIRLTDFTDDVGAVLDAIDFLCLPSLTEGLPNIVLEAAAARVPMVLTRVGEIPFLLENGEDAILVDPGDAVGLATAIEEALRLEDRGRSLAANAYDSLSSSLSSDWIGATRAVYDL